MSITLRDYQQSLLVNARAELAKGHKSVLCVCATGGGKSYIFMDMADRCKGKVMILVHRGELKEQHIREFKKNGIPMDNIIVETVQTVYRRMDAYNDVRMVIADEAHLFMARTFKAVIDHFAGLGAFTIGFSASPCRLDGSSMSDIFTSMVEGPQTAELIKKKRLCPYEYYAPLTVDVSELKKQRGDYVTSEVEALMEPAIYGKVIEEYKRLCPGKQAIAFCVSIAHSQQVAQQFRDAGISAAHVDGNTPRKAREAILADFLRGDIQILTNVNLFSEGISVDGIGAVIMLRPTASLALCLQQWGRGLRYQEGKVCTILDCVGNYTRHGLPDQHREWTLEGKVKEHKEHDEETGEFKVRQCPYCYKCFENKGQKECPYCHEVYPTHPKELQAFEAIQLKKITEAEIKAEEERKARLKEDIRNARSAEDFFAIAKKNGYSHGWAFKRARMRGYI